MLCLEWNVYSQRKIKHEKEDHRWKLENEPQFGRGKSIAKGLLDASNSSSYEVMVFPTAIHLGAVSEIANGSKLIVGAQNAYQADLTAMTGEISPVQLEELGIRTVLVGHSERRQFLGETSEFDNAKISFFLRKGLRVIYCVGETWAEREKGNTFSVLSDQIKKRFKGCPKRPIQKSSNRIRTCLGNRNRKGCHTKRS